MAGITAQITALNSGGTSTPANFSLNSFVAINTQDGPNTIMIDVSTPSSWSQTGGLLALFFPTPSPQNGNTPTVRIIPQSSILSTTSNGVSGITSGVNDNFTLGLNGAGTLYIIAGSGTWAGVATVTLRQGAGGPSLTGTEDLGSITIAGSLPAGTNNIGTVVTQGLTSTPADGPVSVPATTNTPLVAAGTYKNIVLQNNSNQNIWITFSGAALSGGNYTGYYCLYANGGGWQEAGNAITTLAINAWNPGGSTVSVYVRKN